MEVDSPPPIVSAVLNDVKRERERGWLTHASSLSAMSLGPSQFQPVPSTAEHLRPCSTLPPHSGIEFSAIVSRRSLTRPVSSSSQEALQTSRILRIKQATPQTNALRINPIYIDSSAIPYLRRSCSCDPHGNLRHRRNLLILIVIVVVFIILSGEESRRALHRFCFVAEFRR